MDRRQASFSAHSRSEMIERMKTETFDLVVIGGGITGAGVARDAASRGMSVALVEMQDFAQGTSSRSSKLIHGGIRYLENFEFGLVFEALSERRLLFEIAPHLVHPLRFVLPLYKGGRVGMFKMGLGMWLYDALSTFEAPELHERLSPAETKDRLPLLQDRDLLGSYVYSDAYMDDDRLVHETMRSAVELGALAVNYVSAESAELVEGKVRSIGCRDHLNESEFRLRGRHFVSTVGPWTDQVANHLLKSWKKILRPSKGVHLTFDRSRLNLPQAVVMAADQEKRIVFGIPRHEMIIIGTTDTDFSGDPADVSATAEDVRYLLDVAKEYFPGANLTANDIISTYAGVRPLVDDGAETESKTSREHVIINDTRGVTFVAGGKYTTYRRMAAHAVQEAVIHGFGVEEQVRFGRNDTARPLNDLATIDRLADARRLAPELAREYGMNREQIDVLIDRHAGEAESILFKGAEFRGSPEVRLWMVEARHAIRHTMCIKLTDFYVRRAPLFLARQDHGQGMLEPISRVFASELGWTEERRKSEMDSVHELVRRELAWKQNFGISPSSF